MLTFFRFSITLLFIFQSIIFSAADKPVRAENGMVVSADSIASKIGLQILKEGGNAIDAAVATGFALAVTFPYAGNIGGGGFMIIHLEDGKNLTIDFREKAPSSAYKDMYLDEAGKVKPEMSLEGWSSSGVPGSVAGLIYALDNYGTMPLGKVIRPAINLAENGFRVNRSFAASLNSYKNEFQNFESTEKIFVKKDGSKFEAGDNFIQTDLAETLKRIKEEGRTGFYEGETARLIADQSEKMGGFISLDDLKNYNPVERKPVEGNYKGFEIISMPPPSSGGIALIEALNVFENFDFSEDEWNSGNYVHTMTEILRRVYADRSEYLGDSDFYPVPVEELISKDYAEELAREISSDSALSSSSIKPGLNNLMESTETTHYSVIDKNKNAVSVTTTINSGYGSKVVVDGAGFLMNNEMDDFSAKPGVPNQFGLVGAEANSIQPGKRMLSSMTPTIVLKNEEPYLILGSPGGSTIITSVLQVFLNVAEFGMDVSEAVNAPRFHHQWLPDQIDFEKFALVKDVKNNLRQMGHNLGDERTLGRVQAILIDSEIYFGASDPRGDGMAAGY